ncbi:MAG TPA: TonB family protein, partial [Polyangia bacterium]|nr:TonB family protein [Polyangia bacterium]
GTFLFVMLAFSPLSSGACGAQPPPAIRSVGAYRAKGAELTWSREVRVQIRDHWNPWAVIETEDFSRIAPPFPTTVLHMVVRPNGDVMSVGIQRSSGMPDLDAAAVTAVGASLPLPRPPDGLLAAAGVVPFNLAFRVYREQDPAHPAEDEKHDPFPVIFAAPERQAAGSLEKSAISGVIDTHLGDLRSCQEQQKPRAPALDGELRVRFVIAQSGDLKNPVVLEARGLTRSLEGCVLKAMARWRFPKPAGGIVKVTYPFRFVP